MRIWKLKEYERTFLFMIREQIPMVADTQPFWDALTKKLARNDRVTTDEFAALYYATVLVYNAYLRKEPQILIATLDDVRNSDVDLDGRFQTPTYEKMIQTLYVTWAMEKPNGREFCEGSLRFSEEEYAERRQLIERELTDMKQVAKRYIKNLDRIEVKTVQKNR